MITINTISAQRGTTVSTPRPRAGHCALVPTTFVSAWAGVRVDGDVTVMGQSAWSPPV